MNRPFPTNFYPTSSSLHVHRQWALMENVLVPDRQWPKNPYRPMLYVSGYRARTEGVVRLLAEKTLFPVSMPDCARLSPRPFDAM